MASSQKTVLITGGNRGLGKALVESFDKAGWTVLATARRPPTDGSIPGRFFSFDLAQPDAVDRLVSELANEHFVIDLVIHNAGFNPKDVKDRPGYFESTFQVAHFSADNVVESCQINALRPMELTGKLNLSDTAVVVAISSWLGSMTKKNVPGHYGYSGSKALMNMMIKGLAMEWDKTNKSAVTINPGWMKTGMGGSNAEKTAEETADAIRGMADNPGFFKSHNGMFLNTDGSEHPW